MWLLGLWHCSLVYGHQHIRQSYSLHAEVRNEICLEVADYVGESEEENMSQRAGVASQNQGSR
jgi:hypothetical protein